MKKQTGKKRSPAKALTNEQVNNFIVERIKLYAKKRVAWLRYLWSGANTSATGPGSYHSEIDYCLDIYDDPSSEMAWLNQSTAFSEVNQLLANIELTLDAEKTSRFALLTDIFGLNKVERDLIATCLAVKIDPNIAKVYAYLQDNTARTFVSSQLVARLFNHGQFIVISTTYPLLSWGLINEIEKGRAESPAWELDPFISNWLLGITELDEPLTGIARLQTFEKPLNHWPVNETVNHITKLLESNGETRIRILVAGAEGSGRKNFAAAVCWQLGLLSLSINTERIPDQQWLLVYTRAQRQAFLDKCALIWYGSSIFEKYWFDHIAAFQIQFVIGEVDEFLAPVEGITDYRVEITSIPSADCFDLWKEIVPASATWPEEEFRQMLRRQQVTISQITAASKATLDNVSQASELLRAGSRQRLGKLANQMNLSFEWDDLILPPWLSNHLNDFHFEANERVALWENAGLTRLFPQGRGLMALFTGAPGTGKTMAAQVIAKSLQLDLFRIDLSAVISKYVGETSKNIERILTRARRMDVILMFDEADGLFSTRTAIKDAQDRFASADTSFLLQAIEDYPGIAILASNKKLNIDSAFLRRLRYVLEFPKPDAVQRLQLWRSLLTELAGAETADSLDPNIMQIAEMIEITGAQIKLSILSALFMIRRDREKISITHLLKGLERELAKEGRGLGRHINEFFKREAHVTN